MDCTTGPSINLFGFTLSGGSSLIALLALAALSSVLLAWLGYVDGMSLEYHGVYNKMNVIAQFFVSFGLSMVVFVGWLYIVYRSLTANSLSVWYLVLLTGVIMFSYLVSFIGFKLGQRLYRNLVLG